MEWKNLGVQDKEVIDEYLKGNFEVSDYNFTNQYLWSIGEESKYRIENDVLIVKGVFDGQEYYYMPVPKTKSEENLKALEEVIKNILKDEKRIILVPEEWKNILEEKFILEERRESFDYIYTSEDLGTLKGRKFSKKKNKINNFKKLYNYTYEKMDENNIKEVLEFQREWCFERACDSISVLKNENLGIINLLNNFLKMDFVGGILKVDGKIVAYSLGEILAPDYAVIHIEKGLNDYIGSYQMINKLFVENEFLSCKYINREDDFGDIGLREAKESYHPTFLLKKYEIVGIR